MFLCLPTQFDQGSRILRELSHIEIYKKSGILLCSHIVTNVVFSAGHVLTVVFGMGTGVTHDRIDTGQIIIFFPFPSKTD